MKDIINKNKLHFIKKDSLNKKEFKEIVKRMKQAPILIHNIPTKREIVRKGIISRIMNILKK